MKSKEAAVEDLDGRWAFRSALLSPHILFIANRAKHLPVLRCKVTTLAPQRLTTIPRDVDIVAVHRTVGHAAVKRVKKLCVRANVRWCDISTGGRQALEEIHERTSIDLRPWRRKGFWAGSIGQHFLRRAAQKYPTSYDERMKSLNMTLSQASGKRVALKSTAIYAAYRRDLPDYLVGHVGSDADTMSAIELPRVVPPVDAAPAAEVEAVALSQEGSPCPAKVEAFEALLQKLAQLMPEALVGDVTIMAAPDGTVAWTYKHKVVRFVDAVVEGPR